jgi:hypothetical protein
MSGDLENVLRNSLDAVDRGRRWAMLGVVALCLATLMGVASLFAVAASRGPSENGGVFKALFVASAAEMLLIACCTVIGMLHTSRMTKAILRAIESSRGNIS